MSLSTWKGTFGLHHSYRCRDLHPVPGQVFAAGPILQGSVEIPALHVLSDDHCVLVGDTHAQQLDNVVRFELLQDCHLWSIH